MDDTFCFDNDNNLLVPIALNAMVVGKSPDPTIFTNIANDFSRLHVSALGEYVPTGLMDTKDTEKPGVHLHWILPDSLTHGIKTNENEEGEIEYPTVPNRWIVTRLWSSKDSIGDIKTKSWVVESDVLQTECSNENYNKDSLTYPCLDDMEQLYRFLGRSYPVNTQVEKIEDKVDPLTAVSPGNPFFAAFYPYCRNVFGFYDDLLDDNGKILGNIKLTYLVCGYYSDTSNDPLSKIQNKEDCVDKFKWLPPEGMIYPCKSILHGMVCDILWIDADYEYSKEVMHNLPTPKLAAGNNSSEALAALQAVSTKNIPYTERLLQVLMSDQGDKLLGYNGIKNVDYNLHENRFQWEDSLQLSSVEKKKNINYDEVDTKELIPLLSEINSLQEQIKRQYSEYARGQRDIYDLWYKYMLKSKVTNPHEKARARKLMEQYQEQILKKKTELENCQQSIKENEQRLQDNISIIKEKIHKSYNIIEKAGQRYFTPNNPVLLFSKIGRSYSHGQDLRFSEEGVLKCRTDSQIIKQFTLDIDKNNTTIEVTIKGEDLVKKPDLSKDYPPVIVELVREAALLSISFSTNITEYIIIKAKIDSPTRDQINAIRKLVQKIQTQPYGRLILSKASNIKNFWLTDIQESDYPNKIAVNYWTYPWLPLFINWEATYYPDEALLEKTPDLRNWTFKEEDYTYTGEPITSENPVVLSGQMVLTPHAAEQLSNMADKYLKNKSDNRKQLVDKLYNLNILSQAMNGFNERFIMRELSLQMPVFDFESGNQKLAKLVSDIIKGQAIERPRFNVFFSPIRGGYMEIERIQIVDSFGQFQMIKPAGVAVSEDLRDNDQVYNKRIMLPPRFIQPSRLNFQWISSKTNVECKTELGDTPICGWIIPNRIDQSLMVYDDTGIMLGSLLVTGFDGGSVRWRRAPGFVRMPADEDGEIPKNMNKDLYKFLKEIHRLSNEDKINVLTPLLKCIDTSLWNINPFSQQEEKGLSVLIGRPIALVKATLKLEQADIPEEFHLLESNKNEKIPIPEVDISNFKLPVWLGEEVHQLDGLVGFFLTDGKLDYKRFFSRYNEEYRKIDYFENSNQILLPMNPKEKPTSFTMLLDPSAGVHIKSGMLPVKYVQLSNTIVNDALSQLYLTIFNASFLSSPEKIQMPFPIIAHRNWTFVVQKNKNQWIEYTEIEKSNGNAFLSQDPQEIFEGWMKLKVMEDQK